MYDLERLQTPTRVTFSGHHNNVVWSDNGRYLVYAKQSSKSSYSLRLKDLSLGGDDREIFLSEGDIVPLGLDTEKNQLLFAENAANGLFDQKIGVIDPESSSDTRVEKVEILQGTKYNEIFAQCSPDRKLIVLNSDETGRWEIYLAEFPSLRHRFQISTGGGEEPLWTADGKRIIYRWGSSWYEVDVSTEPKLSATVPRMIVSGPYINVPGYSWDMTPDGQQLLLLEGPDQNRTISELHVITNFFTELERKCPTDN